VKVYRRQSAGHCYSENRTMCPQVRSAETAEPRLSSRWQSMSQRERGRLWAIGIVVAGVWAMSACTSSLVLGTAYNAAAKKTADRLKTYADFDQAQQQWIEQSFQSFQQWHRISELPGYSALLTDVATTLRSEQPIPEQQLDTWVNTVEERSHRARSCSPLTGAAEFLTDMADWQVVQLQKTLDTNRQKRYEEYKSETAEERQERRREQMITWASRAGIKFSDEQKQLLDSTLAQQTSMGDRRFRLWEQWTAEFIDLLEQRESNEFGSRLQSHVDSLWTITEKNYPKEWKQNRDLWQGFAHTILNDLCVAQKTELAETITSISESTLTLSRKKSRAEPVCYSG